MESHGSCMCYVGVIMKCFGTACGIYAYHLAVPGMYRKLGFARVLKVQAIELNSLESHSVV